MLDRRLVLLGLAASAAPLPARPRPAGDATLAALEARAGGRLGIAAIGADGRLLLGHRADERFLLCSTFKVFLGGAVLRRTDRGGDALDTRLAIGAGDLVSYSPVVERLVPNGSASLAELIAAAVEISDNAAANLLLDRIGGPPAMTRLFRELGGRRSRLDRRELALNRRAGARDTTTPGEAAAMLRRMLAPGWLAPATRARLEAMMIASPTGRERLRAGLPPGWRSGDKTGTGPAGETNDLAFVDSPGRGRLFVAAYYDGSAAPVAARNAVLAEAARIVAARIG